jgi:pimeloyl-ACP methyl ester carboxylesterase
VFSADTIIRAMAPRFSPRALAVGGAAAAAALTGVALVQRRHLRGIFADPATEALRAMAAGTELPVTSADGTKLHAEVFGAEDGPTVVLIHGWTEGIRYWTYVIGELADEFRLVAYDLRGHGDSGPAAGGDYSLARFGEDVEAVLAAAAPGERVAVVAGHSLGAMSIAAWAENHDVGARAESAALLNTGLGDLIANSLLFPTPVWAKRYSDTIGRRVVLGSRSPIPPFTTPLSHGVIRHLAFGPTATPGQVEFYAKMMGLTKPDVRAAIGVAMADMDLHHALARLTIPTLVMAGERDRLTPPVHARRIAEELPNLTALIELPDTGHMGPLERPHEVSCALAELARSVLGAGTDAARA